MKYIRTFSRILLGLTFMFSGFVKGVDPLGSVYKFNEYFDVFHLTWLSPFTLSLAIILCSLEFIIGYMLIAGIKPKFSTWAVFLFMVFFTGLTLYSYVYNPVSDCGCFGDAIKLTNGETFFKNLILLLLASILISTLKNAKPFFSPKNEIRFLILGAGIILISSVYSIRHLPIIDFLPWKKGNKISEQVLSTPEVSEITLVYKDKKTSELFEYTAKTLPYQDSVKWNSIEFVEQKKKIITPYKEAPIHDFVITDVDGEILTEKIMTYEGYQFILVAYDLNKTNQKAFKNINNFVTGCDTNSIPFIGLTGSVPELIDVFRHEVQAMFPFYMVDETALKSMIRSNPGLILIKDGEIIDKWAWRDIPLFGEIEKNYIHHIQK